MRFVAFLGLLGVFGCAADSGGEVLEPPVDASGKLDVASRIAVREVLDPNDSVEAAFTEDLEFHGYVVNVGHEPSLSIAITQQGTSRKLDTTLFVYGPFLGDGYGTAAIARDNDSGWGKNARIDSFEPHGAGQYLIVVGTADGQGRGAYRLETKCLNGTCEAEHTVGPCVFGDSYSQWVLGAQSRYVITGEREKLSATGLSALDTSQILSAFEASAFDRTEKIGDVFDTVDGAQVLLEDLWDISNRRAFTAVTMALGDTVVGRIFDYGTSVMAAEIQDSTLYDCSVPPGSEGIDCAADGDCTGAATCIGIAAENGLGRCIDTAQDNSPDEGASCTGMVGQECPGGSGLDCAGLSTSATGTCLPAWMHRIFVTDDTLAIPSGNATGATTSLVAYGLSSVDTDVNVEVWISGTGPGRVEVRLTNPAGTDVVLFDGTVDDYVELSQPAAFTGDEDVNGKWTLQVIDHDGGGDPVLTHWKLDLRSRWD